MTIDIEEDRRCRTILARMTSETLNEGSVRQIIGFFRSTRHTGGDQLTNSENLRLQRCADDLEAILKWQEE